MLLGAFVSNVSSTIVHIENFSYPQVPNLVHQGAVNGAEPGPDQLSISLF
jgi:hypothetical protein